MGVILNRIDRGSIRRDADGWVVEEHAYVDGVTGNARAKAYKAATAAGLPVYGAAHPSVPGVFLTSIEARPEPGSTGQWDVTLIYREPRQDGPGGGPGGGNFGPVTLTLRSDVAQEEVRFDTSGNALAVTFRGNYTTQGWVNGELVERNLSVQRAFQILTAETSRPQLTLVLSRWERRPPTLVARQITGAVNRSSWEGFAARSLLCTGVDARARTEGDGYDVDYAMRYNADTWLFEAAINLGFGANPPPEARLGNGIQRYNVYPLYDFARTGLQVPR